MNIGSNIKKNRSRKGLTQEQLASRAGLSRSYVADIERERYDPSVGSLVKIAESLSIGLVDIIGSDSDMKGSVDEKEIFRMISMLSDNEKEAILTILRGMTD